MSIEFRIARKSDAEGILAIYAPYCESTCVSFEVVAPTLDEMRERIQHILPTHPWLVAEISGNIAGYVYANRHRERAVYRWSIDVAVYIGPEHQRKGLGRALYAALFSIL